MKKIFIAFIPGPFPATSLRLTSIDTPLLTRVSRWTDRMNENVEREEKEGEGASSWDDSES